MESGFALTLFGLFMVVMIVTILWPIKLSSKKNKSLTMVGAVIYDFVDAALNLNDEQARYIKPRVDELIDEIKLLRIHWDDINKEQVDMIIDKALEEFNPILKNKINKKGVNK